MNNQITGREVTMTDLNLVIMLRQAAEVGARRALIGAGLESPTIRRKEAIARYGQNDVDRWQKEGLVKPIHDGYRSGYRYSVIELMSAALQSNRRTYMSVAERRQA